jgi:hypothetical protein
MASIEQIQALIIENNTLVEKMITKLNNDLLRKIADLSNPDLIVSKPRTRTITPVAESERCTKTLVSGKNKGCKCSKKATIGTLCTTHNKVAPAVAPVAPAVAPAVAPIEVIEAPVEVIEAPVEVIEAEEAPVENTLSDFMAHLEDQDTQ